VLLKSVMLSSRIYTRGPAKSVQLDDSGENIVTGEDIIAGEEVLEFKSKRTYTQPKILPPPNSQSYFQNLLSLLLIKVISTFFKFAMLGTFIRSILS